MKKYIFVTILIITSVLTFASNPNLYVHQSGKVFRFPTSTIDSIIFSPLQEEPDSVFLYQADGTKRSFLLSSTDSIGFTSIVAVPDTFIVNDVKFTMCYVEAGTFTMGNIFDGQEGYKLANSTPTHEVTLTNDFYIGQVEVTQELWNAVMDKEPNGVWTEAKGLGDNFPTYFVTWNDANNFCKALSERLNLNFRLPTEAEWEFAARGGIHSNNTFYSGSNERTEVAWCSSNAISPARVREVKSLKSNELGLYDMSGNCWEWCSDYYGLYTAEAKTNPIGPETGTNRVRRGGGKADGLNCSIFYHNGLSPDFSTSDQIGFRFVLIR